MPNHIEEKNLKGFTYMMNHSNRNVVMSIIKVILKFMEHIDNINKIRNHYKTIFNSSMSIMMISLKFNMFC